MESQLVEDVNMQSFMEALHHIVEERDNRGKRHDLVFIVAAVTLSILCGRSKTSSIHRFIENRMVWLREATQLNRLMLSHALIYCV